MIRNFGYLDKFSAEKSAIRSSSVQQKYEINPRVSQENNVEPTLDGGMV
jgi:hypothetical protein